MSRQMSQSSDILSPSMHSSSRRNQYHNQIKKPLAESHCEEAYPESPDISSDEINDDEIPFTDREQIIVEDPRSPKPPRQNRPNPMDVGRCSESKMSPARNMHSNAQSEPVINQAELMNMLASEQSIGGFITINGKQFRLVSDVQSPNPRPLGSSPQNSYNQNPFHPPSHRPMSSQDFSLQKWNDTSSNLAVTLTNPTQHRRYNEGSLNKRIEEDALSNTMYSRSRVRYPLNNLLIEPQSTGNEII